MTNADIRRDLINGTPQRRTLIKPKWEIPGFEHLRPPRCPRCREVHLHDCNPADLAAARGISIDAAPAEVIETLHVEARKATLRIDARAREELAAETMPAIPAARPGNLFLAEPDDSPAWRIDGLWPANGNVMLTAQFKAGKTTLRDNLIRSWCDGEPFLGAYPIDPPAGPLFVIDAEMSDTTARRWLRTHHIGEASRFTFVSLRGAASSMNLLVPAARRQWARMIHGAGAVLLDCLGPVMGSLGLDENKPADVGRFFAAFDQLLGEAGVHESLVIHHMGHAAERARGASRLRDWPDAEWRLVRLDDNPASPRYLSAYGRDVDLPESRLGWDPATRRLTIDGGSRKDDAGTAAVAALLAFLEDHPRSSGRQIHEVLEASHGRPAVKAAITEAVRTGDVITGPGPRRATLHSLSAPVRSSAPVHTGTLAPSSAPPFIGGALAHSPEQQEDKDRSGALKRPALHVAKDGD